MAGAEDLLVHVRQRLDALTYDDHSQYLLSSVQASPYMDSLAHTGRFQPQGAALGASGGATLTTSRRQTFLGSWARCVGLTAFYLRLILLLGTGWLFAMIGIFTFLYALPAAQEDIVLTSTAQMILLLGVYFLGGAVGCVLFGVCADHFGRRPVLMAALSFWLIVNALTAGAWNYTSFVTMRFLAGIGIGGQLALLATLALEYTPTRTRGRITILTVSIAGLGVFGGVAYGQLASAALGEGGLGWRATYGVLSAMAVLFLAVLYLALDESPKYLASVGRAVEALKVLDKIESAHGINRQARVTVPSSLYEPPSQRPQVSYERYLEDSSSDSDFEMELEESRRRHRDGDYDNDIPAYASFQMSRANTSLNNIVGPGAANARSQSLRTSARRQSQAQRQYQLQVCTPTSQMEPGTPNDGLAPTTGVSFLTLLRRRVVVLLSGPLALRTALSWFFWFAEFVSLSASIVTALMMAGTYIKMNAIGTGFGVEDQLFWSAMVFPGLLITALVVETIGRRATLATFVFCGGLVMLVSAWLLEEDGAWSSLSLALGMMVLTTGGTIGAMITFTGEQFPLLTRALGISCAAAWGHLGMFAGVYLVLRRVMGDAAWTWHDERVMLAVCGGISILLLPVIIFMGAETRGRDIDAPWYGGNKAMQVLRGGEAVVDSPGARDQSKIKNALYPNKLEIFDKMNESSEDGNALPESPFGRGSTNGVVAPPALYSPASAALVTMHSPVESSSSSSSSGFWQTHTVRHLGRKVTRTAQSNTGGDEKLALSHSPVSNHQAHSISMDAKRARGGTVNIEDRCNTLPIDALDQPDDIVTEHEYHNRRMSADRLEGPPTQRRSLLNMMEPVLLDWRRSFSSSFSGSGRDLSSSSKASKTEHSAPVSTEKKAAIPASDVRSSETGRYTIDLDMFDTFTYISTPVLGGDNYADHDPREPSNVAAKARRKIRR
ncbi:hypothetical protein PHYBOEH_008420 [Phytophthora boehmeriae]|uniref:Major facilitator superfamily (MFS) profile domain-containing protein n=1 Tax=Phytophthora boehmeriae TaxID=109152 RepID=A0A8T1X025_9STRA|nr:hypothetical protein PHYBOEH_008420 [Phytophthora boehmeriae]